ncbi:serine/threonine protein kinase [Nocardiopsis nanhaiensis]
MDDAQNQVGQDRVVGGYRLLKSLGRGGFGEVFLGEADDGTLAAVKLLHANWAGDADMRRRFAAEVDQAKRVSGFCVAAILGADPTAEQPWIATEFIDGPTLQASVEKEGPRAGVQLQRLAIGTATALAAIHAAGVVHRDLKPDNIMLAPDGPRVIDFGIARAVEATSVTASGVVGTIGYMAPEQLEGARLTSAIDVFSWASVMVFAATGKEAFHAPTQAARIAKVLGGQPDMAGLEGAFADTLRACLDKSPEERPDAETLMRWLIASPTSGGPTGGPGPVGDTDQTTVSPSPDAEHTEVAPSPDARTKVGVDRTKVAQHPPTGVDPIDPTRVAPQAKVGPTRPYTRLAPDASAPSAPHAPPRAEHASAPPPPPFSQDSGAQSSGLRNSGPGHSGAVPPYHFVGVRVLDPGSLAAEMQRNWNAAVQVFNDPTERAALGAWLMEDLGDTTVDRSLFRREVDDANLAVASFIAQTRPDLPPVFRGRGVSVPELRELFADPQPLLTGAPMANEMVLLARPGLLRIMNAHESPEPGAHQHLADQLDRAEHAGTALHETLSRELVGWRSTRPNVNPALVLAFLLNPERVTPPGTRGDAGMAEWVDILWQRVTNAPHPDSAGYAAAVYGAMSTVQALAQQRRYWEERYSQVSGTHGALQEKVQFQERLSTATRWCKYGIIGIPVGFVMDAAAQAGNTAVVVAIIGGLLMYVGLFSVLGAIGSAVTNVVMNGDAKRRAQRIMELRNSSHQLPQLTSGVQRIRTDMDRAREITVG